MFLADGIDQIVLPLTSDVPSVATTAAERPLRVSGPGWLAVAVVVAALALRIGAIDRQGLWVDEVFSLAMATGHSLENPAAVADPRLGDFVEESRPLLPAALRRYAEPEGRDSVWRVLRAVRLSDTSPPLYYILLNPWLRLVGGGDAALRLFSLGWFAACLPLMWALGRLLGGASAALVACVLFGFSPVAVRYSIEGRMYSLLWFLVLATLWLALRLREDGAGASRLSLSIPKILLLIALSAAGLLTHYFYVFVWLALCAWLLFRPGNLERRAIFVTMAAAGLLALPWYVPAIASLDDWRVTQGWLNARQSGYRAAAVPLELAANFFSNTPGDRLTLPALRWVALAVLPAAIALWWRGAWLLGGIRTALWVMVGAACLGPLVFDLVFGTYAGAVPRYALTGFPAAILLVAAGASRLGGRARAAAVTAIVLAWTPGLWSIYADEARGTSPLREVAVDLASRAGRDDLIVVHTIPSGAVGLARYLDAPAPLIVRISQLRRPVVPGELEELLSKPRRVFLVKIRAGGVSPEETHLRERATLIHETRVRNSVVLEFVQHDAAVLSRLPGTLDPVK